MDKLTAIQVFLSVAETGSFTQTAERLEISKPMVTRHVALMEEWLNAKLFQRTTRKVSLTNAGEEAIFFCRKIATMAAEMEHEMSAHQGELRGVIRIAASTTLGSDRLSLLINRFLAQHPKLRIHLFLGERAVDLLEERVDLALRFTNQPDENLIARKLADCHSLLVAAPDYLFKHGVPQHPNDLRHHHCIAHAHLNRKYWQFQQHGKTLNLELPARFTTNDTFSQLNSALSGNGIAMLPKFMLDGKLQSGELQALLTDWQTPALTLYALYPSRQLPLAVRKLLDFLTESFGQMEW